MTFAFPSGHNPQRGRQEDGMTLRDYFAAHIAGHLAVKAVYDDEKPETVAAVAYMVADSLMKAREE